MLEDSLKIWKAVLEEWWKASNSVGNYFDRFIRFSWVLLKLLSIILQYHEKNNSQILTNIKDPMPRKNSVSWNFRKDLKLTTFTFENSYFTVLKHFSKTHGVSNNCRYEGKYFWRFWKAKIKILLRNISLLRI